MENEKKKPEKILEKKKKESGYHPYHPSSLDEREKGKKRGVRELFLTVTRIVKKE